MIGQDSHLQMRDVILACFTFDVGHRISLRIICNRFKRTLTLCYSKTGEDLVVTGKSEITEVS